MPPPHCSLSIFTEHRSHFESCATDSDGNDNKSFWQYFRESRKRVILMAVNVVGTSEEIQFHKLATCQLHVNLRREVKSLQAPNRNPVASNSAFKDDNGWLSLIIYSSVNCPAVLQIWYICQVKWCVSLFFCFFIHRTKLVLQSTEENVSTHLSKCYSLCLHFPRTLVLLVTHQKPLVTRETKVVEVYYLPLV